MSQTSSGDGFLFSYVQIKEYLSLFEHSGGSTVTAYLRFILWAPNSSPLKEKLLSIKTPAECYNFLLDVTNKIQKAGSKTAAALWVSFRSAIFNDLLHYELGALCAVYTLACDQASLSRPSADTLKLVSALIKALDELPDAPWCPHAISQFYIL